MKRLLKACWRATHPIHRPITTRLKAFIKDCIARGMASQNPTVELAREISLSVDALISEHDRLHRRVEELQRSIERLERRGPVAWHGDDHAAA